MISQETYESLKDNFYFKRYKDNYCVDFFDELMIQMLIKKEKSDYYDDSPIQLIRDLRTETNNMVGLKDLKHFVDILKALEVVDFKTLEISDDIYLINSINDVVYMISSRMTANQFARFHKLRKLKANILKKN